MSSKRARLFRLLAGRRDPTADIDAELELHLQLRIETLISEGHSPDDARARALLAFGDLGGTRSALIADAQRDDVVRRIRERCGDAAREIRQAIRSLVRVPLVSLGAVSALALGIGATTTMFSIGQAILGELPVPEPERLVQLVNFDRDRAVDDGPLRLAEILAARTDLRAVTGLAAWSDVGIHLGDGKRVAERVSGSRVSAGLFAVLGVAPRMGREFVPAEELPGAPAVMMISDRLWRDRFDADPGVIGATVRVNGRPTTIVGVLPADLEFPSQAKAWLPLAIDPGLAARDTAPGYLTIARLAPGRRLEDLQAEASRLGVAMIRQRGGRTDREELGARPFAEWFVGPTATVRVHGITLLVSTVLLIACANVSNLLLARALSRRAELAVRTALGSSRAAVVRSLALEALLLAVGGGVLGVGLALLGASLGNRALGHELPAWSEVQVDWRVLAFVGVLVLLTSVLAGLAPARRATRLDPGEVLRSQTRGGAVRLGAVSRELVTAQIGLAVFLLMITGFIAHGIAVSLQVDPVLRPEEMATARIELAAERYPQAAEQTAVVERILERIRDLPGVVAATAGTNTPGFFPAAVPFRVVGSPDQPVRAPSAFVSAITPGYFATYGVPLLDGREFAASDRADSRPVALVSRRFAERYFPRRAALGGRVEIAGPAAPFLPGQVPMVSVEIVGVVPDNEPLDEPPEGDVSVYLPLAQAGDQRIALGIRTKGDPEAVVRAIGPAVFAVDPDVPVFRAMRMMDLHAEGTRGKRLFATLFAVFGLAGLVIAAVGLFAIVAFGVRQRDVEIAVRAALGESAASIVWRVARGGLVRLALGLIIGLGVAALVSPKLGALLFGSRPNNPTVFGAVAAAVALVSLTAILIPASRSRRIDPAIVLRQ